MNLKNKRTATVRIETDSRFFAHIINFKFGQYYR